MLRIPLLSSLACAFLLLCGTHVIYNALQPHDCEMTWMYQRPQYPRVNLSKWVESTFSHYTLHLYKESGRKTDKKLKLLSSPPVLQGIPVLFIPGNAGSYKQVRSSASIALTMYPSEFRHLGLHWFDFFAVNLNEELSGAFGGVLEKQTAYVALCIQHILSMYPSEASSPSPNSVILITHSMGGVVAHALFTLPEFNHSTVNTIIALASPLRRPVFSFDSLLQQYYESVEAVWSEEGGVASNVTVVSIAGGEKDIQVPTDLTRTGHSINVGTAAVARNWVSADHQAVVWCRRVQLAVVRALFLLQEPPQKELVRDRQRKDSVFSHLLLTGGSVPMKASNAQLSMKAWYNLSTDHHYQNKFQVGYNMLATPHSSWLNKTLLIASNTPSDAWVYQCAPLDSKTGNCTDISPDARLLPPTIGYTKYITLLPGDVLATTTHTVVKQPSGLVPKTKVPVYVLVEQCDTVNYDLSLGLLGGEINLPAKHHCSLMNFTLPHLRELWQVYTATVTSCAPIVAGLVTPWYPHTPLLHSNGSHHLTQTLSLLVPPPQGSHAQLVVWAPRECSVEVVVDPDFPGLLSKLLVLYAPFIPVWLTAVSIATPAPPLALELLAVTALHTFATSYSWSPDSEWAVLEREGVWSAWAPPFLLLLARGAHQLLLLTVAIVSGGIRRNVSREKLWAAAGALSVASLASLCLCCSGAGLLCMVIACALTAASTRDHELLCVLLCLQFLTLPTLFTWIREIRYSFTLSVDPHYWTVLVTVATLLPSMLSRALLLGQSEVQSSSFCGMLYPFRLRWDTLLQLLASLLLILTCLTRAHRTSYYIAPYIALKHYISN